MDEKKENLTFADVTKAFFDWTSGNTKGFNDFVDKLENELSELDSMTTYPKDEFEVKKEPRWNWSDYEWPTKNEAAEKKEQKEQKEQSSIADSVREYYQKKAKQTKADIDKIVDKIIDVAQPKELGGEIEEVGDIYVINVKEGSKLYDDFFSKEDPKKTNYIMAESAYIISCLKDKTGFAYASISLNSKDKEVNISFF